METLTAAQFSAQQRERLAKKGVAMRDGSFPIRNKSDLKNAIRDLGFARDRATAKRHIIKRARALGAVDLLPESYGITAAAEQSAHDAKVEKVMREFKAGRLKSNGKVVTSRKQALAIALSEARGLTAVGFDESKHPRHPSGSSEGGRFSRKGEVLAKIAAHADDQTKGVYQRGVIPSEEPEVAELVESGDVTEGTHGKLRPTTQGYDTLRQMQESGEAPGQAPRTEPGVYVPTGEQRDSFDSGYAEMDWLEDAEDDEIRGEWEEIHEDPDRYGEADPDYVDGQKERLMEVAEQRGIELKEYDPDAPDRGNPPPRTASALTAAAAGLAPLTPPKAWFDKPNLDGPTPITVTADGRVFGHAALWNSCHTGMSNVCRTPPRGSDYRFFHLGEIDTDAGPVAVGRVTMNTGHAPLTASRESTVRHYDDTGTGAAHVRAYEDAHGIVLAGALMPDLPAEDARRFRGAPVSGDWRSINGKLELVGMLAVNVPGFPVPRAMAASLMVEDEPHTMSLVAAGMYCDPLDEDRKLKALVARARGVDGLVEAAMGGTVEERRRRSMVAAAPFDPAKHPRHPAGSSEGGRWARVTNIETGEVTYRQGLASQVVSELRQEGEKVGGPDATVKVAPIDKPPAEDQRIREGGAAKVGDSARISKHGKSYTGKIERVGPKNAMVTYTTDNGKTKTVAVPHSEYKVVG